MTVDRGAMIQPKRWPGLSSVGSPRPVSPRHTAWTRRSIARTPSSSQCGANEARPVLVQLPGRFEEPSVLGVEDDADVEELLAVDAGHDPEHDVLVGLHAAALPGTQAVAVETRLEQGAVGRSDRAGVVQVRSRLEPLVGHVVEAQRRCDRA